MASAHSAGAQATNGAEAITDIRERLATLMNRQVTPAVVEVGGQADDAIRAAVDIVRDRTDAMAGRVRARPIGAVMVAAAVGYVLGRVLH